ncbi:hypothetical protein Dsin_011055 [Dipteronia sinensis]|uniref:non-specific serine/threonine protein kinase n=1 Tax=Dipteronia sinensis TaxID=43782 RepID=A0AAE0AUC9_9ROSI|nr:hypothetical protein Dsin_011055 [Dipteronia sinensis]
MLMLKIFALSNNFQKIFALQSQVMLAVELVVTTAFVYKQMLMSRLQRIMLVHPSDPQQAVYFSYHKRFLQSFSSVPGANIRSYSYKEHEEATGGFKQVLGRGAFRTVYKGVILSDARRFVVVKKLDKMEHEREKEFKTEVSVIGQTHHKNLVGLLGFCDEGEHWLLVYEYMSNGSLASFLFGISRPNWNQRVQIVLGIARGLMCLHEEHSTQIIHCDIKPQNILLDEYFTARISDFGLAKLLLADQT